MDFYARCVHLLIIKLNLYVIFFLKYEMKENMS